MGGGDGKFESWGRVGKESQQDMGPTAGSTERGSTGYL